MIAEQAPHTREHPLQHTWQVCLETSVSPSLLKARLGDLASKVDISENRYPGYDLPNPCFPFKVRATKQALSDAEKREVYRRLGVEA